MKTHEILTEDWGSSDWSVVMNALDEWIDEHGLSPETIMQGAYNLAETYGSSMGYDRYEDAARAIKDHWVRTSKRGQQLQKMFAPRR